MPSKPSFSSLMWINNIFIYVSLVETGAYDVDLDPYYGTLYTKRNGTTLLAMSDIFTEVQHGNLTNF